MSIRGFFGSMIMGLGWIIFLLCGGCTVIFSFQMGSQAFLWGGLPILLGWGLIGLGRLIRGPKRVPLIKPIETRSDNEIDPTSFY